MDNKEKLDLLFQSIFLKSNPLILHLKDQVQKKLPLKTSHLAVIQITQILKEWIDLKEGPELLQTLQCLLTLETYKQEVEENKICYLEKSYKQHWNIESDLSKARITWPNPDLGQQGLYEILPQFPASKFLTKDMTIGSAGSCFAAEIAKWLLSHNFNYLVTESNKDSNEVKASALWGLMFNTSSFRMLIEKSLLNREIPKILWTAPRDGKTVYLDPFREDIVFDSQEEFEENYTLHQQAAKEALIKSQVFVITLGMNEVWYLRNTDYAFSRCPWRISSSLVEKKVLSVQENLDELEKMYTIWKQFNPKLKLIVTVSPIPIHASFRGKDNHVVSANCHSKSTLRVVAESFSQAHKDVWYFPSYESVMYCTENAWLSDQRHVSRKTVEKVMQLFSNMFIKEDESLQ